MEKALRLIKHVKSGLRSFHAGNFLLDDPPQLGRPGEVNSEQIETLIKNKQCYTTWDIDNTLTISKSIKLLGKTKNIFYFMEKTK